MPRDPAQTGMQPSTLTLPHTGGSEQERKDKPPEVVSGGWGNGGEMLDGKLEGLELHASVVCLPGDAGRWRVGRSMSGSSPFPFAGHLPPYPIRSNVIYQTVLIQK